MLGRWCQYRYMGHDVHDVVSQVAQRPATPLGFSTELHDSMVHTSNELPDGRAALTIRLPSVMIVGQEAGARHCIWKVQSGGWEEKTFCETAPFCLRSLLCQAHVLRLATILDALRTSSLGAKIPSDGSRSPRRHLQLLINGEGSTHTDIMMQLMTWVISLCRRLG